MVGSERTMTPTVKASWASSARAMRADSCFSLQDSTCHVDRGQGQVLAVEHCCGVIVFLPLSKSDANQVVIDDKWPRFAPLHVRISIHLLLSCAPTEGREYCIVLHGHSSPKHLSCSSPADYLVLASVDGGAGSSTACIYTPLQLIAF